MLELACLIGGSSAHSLLTSFFLHTHLPTYTFSIKIVHLGLYLILIVLTNSLRLRHLYSYIYTYIIVPVRIFMTHTRPVHNLLSKSVLQNVKITIKLLTFESQILPSRSKYSSFYQNCCWKYKTIRIIEVPVLSQSIVYHLVGLYNS